MANGSCELEEPVLEEPALDAAGFDAGFRHELRRTERVRAVLLGVLFAIGGVVMGTALYVGARSASAGLVSGSEWMLPVGACTAFTVYELSVARWLRGHLDQGTDPPDAWRWVNLAVELGACIGLMALVASKVDLMVGLTGPPSTLPIALIFLSALYLDPKLGLFGGVFATVGYGLLFAVHTDAVFALAPELGPIAAPPTFVGRLMMFLLSGVIAALVAQQIRARVVSTIEAAEERREVLDLFGQQVSPEVVNKLLEQPAGVETETRHVCVMFLDIRNFTTFSEDRSPEEVVDFLNTLFGRMIAVINDHQGIVNKFLGDGFLAVFGAPISDGRDSTHAVAASRRLVAVVDELVADGTIPPTRVGIGLHAGQAVTGNVGSHLRKEYTVIGDVVNTAARIESLNKQYDAQILVSGEVYAAVGEQSGAEQVGPVAVKGRQEPVEVWKLA